MSNSSKSILSGRKMNSKNKRRKNDRPKKRRMENLEGFLPSWRRCKLFPTQLLEEIFQHYQVRNSQHNDNEWTNHDDWLLSSTIIRAVHLTKQKLRLCVTRLAQSCLGKETLQDCRATPKQKFQYLAHNVVYRTSNQYGITLLSRQNVAYVWKWKGWLFLPIVVMVCANPASICCNSFLRRIHYFLKKSFLCTGTQKSKYTFYFCIYHFS